jgi:SAM-dependent methyltransferase
MSGAPWRDIPGSHAPDTIGLVPTDDHRERRRQSFGGIAADYDRYRPGPPDEALDWLLPESAKDVLEIGAGTGALTRKLIRRVPHVRAVEPDPRMRTVLEDRVPQAEVVEGRAEEIPADDSSFDAVIAASSWHWVDEDLALPEVARVLRPGGMLCLLWNGADRSVDRMRELWAGGQALGPDQADAENSRRHDRHRVHLGAESPFTEPEHQVIRWNMSMSKDDLLGWAGTYSEVIVMDEPQRQERLETMARFLEDRPEFAGHDVVDVPMRCLCWRTTLR